MRVQFNEISKYLSFPTKIVKPTFKNAALWAIVILGSAFACTLRLKRFRASLSRIPGQIGQISRFFPFGTSSIKKTDSKPGAFIGTNSSDGTLPPLNQGDEKKRAADLNSGEPSRSKEKKEEQIVACPLANKTIEPNEPEKKAEVAPQEKSTTEKKLEQLIYAYRFFPGAGTEEIIARANADPRATTYSFLRDCAIVDDYEKIPADLRINGFVEEGSGEVGCTTAQGVRRTNEDSVIITAFSIKGTQYQFYSVNDGHGGDEAALFVAANLPGQIEKALNENIEGDEAVPLALQRAFLRTHIEYCENGSSDCGSTVCGVLRRGNELWTANLGDTRAVVVTEGGQQALSDDADPAFEYWKGRVKANGGRLDDCTGYIMSRNGQFTLTTIAAVGDEDVPGMIHMPEVSYHHEQSGKYLVIACDGFWDVCSIEDAGTIVRHLSSQNLSPQEMATALVKTAYMRENRVRESSPFLVRRGDNITVMVVPLSA